jgi:hypothetical protein
MRTDTQLLSGNLHTGAFGRNMATGGGVHLTRVLIAQEAAYCPRHSARKAGIAGRCGQSTERPSLDNGEKALA